MLFRNKLLKEYKRSELEDIFLDLCQQLDEKLDEIEILNKQLNQKTIKKIIAEFDLEDDNKREVEINGKDVPEAVKSYKEEIEKMLHKLEIMDLTLRRAVVKRDSELRELNYYRSFFINSEKKLMKSQRSRLEEWKSFIALLQSLFDKTNNWDKRNRILAAIHLLKSDFGSAAPFIQKLNPYDEDHMIFTVKNKRDEIHEVEEQIEKLQQRLILKKGEIKKQKIKLDALETTYQERVEKARDIHLERTALDTKRKKYEEELSRLQDMENDKCKLMDDITNIQNDIDDRIRFAQRNLGFSIFDLKSECCQLESEIDTIKENIKILNTKIEKDQNDLNEIQNIQIEEYNHVKEANDLINEIKDQYRTIRDEYLTLISKTSIDIMDNKNFFEFVSQMGTMRYDYSSIIELINQVKQLKEHSDEMKAKIEKYQNRKTRLKDVIKGINLARVNRMKEFVDEQRALSEKVKQLSEHNIVIYEGQAAFMITITSIVFDTKYDFSSKLFFFISITFFNQTLRSNLFTPYNLNESDIGLLFIVEKGEDLIMFLQSSYAILSLCNVEGTNDTILCQENISLSNFLISSNTFGNELHLKTPSGLDVCSLLYRVELMTSLY